MDNKLKKITLKEAEKYLIYKVVSGSKAYGTNTPESDIDYRGIYVLPNEYLISNNTYVEQVSDETNDITYYELNRFMQLLETNNPNIIELLFVEKENILYKDKRMDLILDNKQKFLTVKIKNTFGGYAVSQIKKATGLNKKITQTMSKTRKTPLDFCYIFEKENGYSFKAKDYFKKKNLKQDFVGLSKLPNGRDIYKLYYDHLNEVKNTNPKYSDIKPHGFKGIVNYKSNELKQSEIPKNYPLQAFLIYNRDGYSQYCKDYKEYFEWVYKRNPKRYTDNIKHGQNYDSKNMMHCIRLLECAIEIGKTKNLKVKRYNYKYLLKIRNGEYSYKEIMNIVKEKDDELKKVFKQYSLPEKIEEGLINDIILKIRNGE